MQDRPLFPLVNWIFWIICLIIALSVDFSFIGLQLTIQYILPIMVGLVASSFTYSWPKFFWAFQQFSRLIIVVFAVFVVYKALTGYSPHMASTPMLLYVMATISLGYYYVFGEKKFLVIFLILFLMPFLSVTRMAILVFVSSFVIHFSNQSVSSKIPYALLGLILFAIVFSSESFQKKTFYDGEGELSDISINYYESNSGFNTNGRTAWQRGLEPGLAANPIFGNGPRSDNAVLSELAGESSAEAHNDYLSVRYNYGWVGLICLLGGFVSTFVQLLKLYFKDTISIFKVLIGSTLTLFVGFLFFMYSDNILKYTIFFPNYFFAMVGITYSASKRGLSYL
ncbi:O-antigen ligase family protein [Algoriphagus halophytocola]|uniref:O-antigen ligase family protein n=1 Tax=Algoriphagus halophytocola TaxID=2991499 RepID=A0ABY6MGX3_9BACT|nr:MULTISPECIES: O-antigen ligase family protein [unclassified Algoriphagus]UZD23048.1 O-antigen ligase family protein [Algoriphagus sp. TR-M5]WBL44340.1 O-antigen ligase family protein [Algoriphagus sp. TR-M9]